MRLSGARKARPVRAFATLPVREPRDVRHVEDAVARASWAVARVGLEAREYWPAGMLSHGDKRKLELAMLLGADKRVLLLDEPMAGVSMEDVPELVELIRSVHVDEGKTVLMVEHHMEVVIGLAQRIAVMHGGRSCAFAPSGCPLPPARQCLCARRAP